MKNNLWNILKKELRELFRDKKSLAMMLIIPIFIPLIMIGMSALFEMQANKDVEEFNKIGFAYELSAEEKQIAEQMSVEVINGTEEELKEKYENGEIQLYITKDGNKYTINNDGSDISSYAKGLMDSYFNAYKEYLQQNYLQENGVNPNEVLNIITVEENVTEEENFFGNYIKVYAFLFIIMAITVSATYPATDTTAGEKERGTLETMLTFPIKRKELILGKYFAIVISGVITMTIGIVLSIFSLWYAWNNFSIYDGTTFNMEILTIVLIIVVLLFYTLFISGLCISIASFSKTFKEAQTALTPISLVTCIPMFLEMLSINIGGALSFIPIINHTIVINEMLLGNINISSIIITIISSCAYIVLLIMYIVREYNREKILFG